MKTQYTPEPWHLGMKPGPMIYGPQGEQVANMHVAMLEQPEHVANAQRIVECVNALAGVADPANAIAAAREALFFVVRYMEVTEEESGVLMTTGLEHARAALALLKGVQP